MFNAMTEQVRQALEAPAKELNDRLDAIHEGVGHLVAEQQRTNTLLQSLLAVESAKLTSAQARASITASKAAQS